MIDIAEEYRPPQAKWWQGRSDGSNAKRYHEVIHCINILQDLPLAHGNVIALIGFACDEGIRRNQGRPGAIQGPEAFRREFANLPVHLKKDTAIYDIGDIMCYEGDLESAQKALADVTDALLKLGVIPVVIGGGHELSWGQFQGLALANPEASYSIVNFDAHYDLRPLLEGGRGSSGTSFRQIADYCRRNNLEFDYTCIGVQRISNTTQLFEEARSLKVNSIFADQVMIKPQEIYDAITEIISKDKPIYLSLCLDVFAAPFAPGVSAPQPLGLYPWQVVPIINHLIKSGKVATIGVAELAPPYDQDNRTARLAAQIIGSAIELFH